MPRSVRQAREMTLEVPRPQQPARSRKAIALAIAGLADLIQVAFLPLFSEGFASPFDDVLDAVTALLLVAILGFDWRLVAALGMELVPGASLFPSWTAAVLSLPARSREQTPVERIEPLHVKS